MSAEPATINDEKPSGAALALQTKFTASEAAKLYGKARRTIYNAMEGGDLPYKHEERKGQSVRVIDLCDLITRFGEIPACSVTADEEDVAADAQDKATPSQLVAVEIARLQGELEKYKEIAKERDNRISDLKEQVANANQQLNDLKKSHDNDIKLITDQRDEAAKEREEKEQLRLELDEKKKGFFAKIFGL